MGANVNKHRTRLEMVAEYLVVKMLAGKRHIVDALYKYFVEGVSPSTLEGMYGITKHQIRGYVQRILEKTGSYTRAKVFIKYLYPAVIRVRPIMVPIDGEHVKCLMCEDIMNVMVAEDHIKRKHAPIINVELYHVLELLAHSLRS